MSASGGAQNPYKVLQVDPSAEPEVIEAAYRRLVRKYHPDVNAAPAAEARMKDLNEAYAIVRDATRRAEFDRRRAPWLRWRPIWPWGRPPRPSPASRAGGSLSGADLSWPGRRPCSRHGGQPAVGECHVCRASLCGSCVSLVQPAGCAPCVWRRARRVQLRALGAIAGFLGAFLLVLAIGLATVRAPFPIALTAAYLVSATALGIAVMVGRMWRSGWQDEPHAIDLGVTFLVWIGLLIGWIGAPVLLVKMARDVGRAGRLAELAGQALM